MMALDCAALPLIRPATLLQSLQSGTLPQCTTHSITLYSLDILFSQTPTICLPSFPSTTHPRLCLNSILPYVLYSSPSSFCLCLQPSALNQYNNNRVQCSFWLSLFISLHPEMAIHSLPWCHSTRSHFLHH